MLQVKDINYIAGLMEGEGCFMHRKFGNGDGLDIQISMTDKDVIDRFHKIVGFGARSERKLPSGKTAYNWRSTDQSRSAGLMMTLLPLMSARRSEKIIECLAKWKLTPLPKIQWTHCKNGHELSGDNLRIVHEGKYEKRRCRLCERARAYKHRLNLRGKP